MPTYPPDGITNETEMSVTISIGVSLSTKIERMIWNDIAGKTIEYSAEPERWLNRALLLAVHDEWTRNGRDFPEGSETVTIVFDAEHKVSIQLEISAGVLETN